MLSLAIRTERIYFKDIRQEHLAQILDWYNKVDDFKFATGIDRVITLEMLARKYAEAAISSSEFFVGIFSADEDRMIGILKGRVQHEPVPGLGGGEGADAGHREEAGARLGTCPGGGGALRYNNAVWISSIVIDTPYQNRGYGKNAVELLLGHLKKSGRIQLAMLAVIEENVQGRKFWERLGFKTVRRMQNHLELHEKKQNVIIMSRVL